MAEVEVVKLEGKIIRRPWHGPDGINACDGRHWDVRRCIIDLTDCPLDELDEAVGVTCGSSAHFRECWIRGAGKLALIGCGDADQLDKERGKSVTFSHCVLSNFGRRGPEVQDGMIAYLNDCLVMGWGAGNRFDTRSFAAWAHGEGSKIFAHKTVFWQDSVWPGLVEFVVDLANHVGNAVNEMGLRGLFSRHAWLPGTMRGITASSGGEVLPLGCWTNNDWVVLEGNVAPMSKDEAMKLVADKKAMIEKLLKTCTEVDYEAA